MGGSCRVMVGGDGCALCSVRPGKCNMRAFFVDVVDGLYAGVWFWRLLCVETNDFQVISCKTGLQVWLSRGGGEDGTVAVGAEVVAAASEAGWTSDGRRMGTYSFGRGRCQNGFSSSLCALRVVSSFLHCDELHKSRAVALAIDRPPKPVAKLLACLLA